MRHVVALNQPFYRRLDRTDKARAGDALIAFFESRGSRFVEASESSGTFVLCSMIILYFVVSNFIATRPSNFVKGYNYVHYERALEKIMQALREKKTYCSKTTNAIRALLDVKTPTVSTPEPTRSSGRISVKGTSKKSNAKAKSSKESSKNSAKSVKVKKQKPVKVKKAVKIAAPKRKDNTAAKILQDMALSKPKHDRLPSKTKPRSSSFSSSKSSKGPPPAWTGVRAGDRLGIYWDLDKIYYPGTVEAIDGSKIEILYDDGERESVDLAKNKFFRWKEGLNKRLRPPEPTKKVAALKAAAEKGLQSPNHSVLTQHTTDSESPRHPRHALMENHKPKVKIEGAFVAPVAARVPCLADFLRRKIDQRSPSNEVCGVSASSGRTG